MLRRELKKVTKFVLQKKNRTIFVNYLQNKQGSLCRLEGEKKDTTSCVIKTYEEGNLYIMPNGDIFPCGIASFIFSKDKYNLFCLGNIKTAKNCLIQKNSKRLKNDIAQFKKSNLFCLNKTSLSKKSQLEDLLKSEYEYFNRTILGNPTNRNYKQM